MRHEAKIITFTVSGNENERPGIVIESENGRRRIKLLTGQSGNASVTESELEKLQQIVSEAAHYIKSQTNPAEPPQIG